MSEDKPENENNPTKDNGANHSEDNGDELSAEWQAAMDESENSGDESNQKNPVHTAELDPLEDDSTPIEIDEDGPQLDVILDIPVKISMEVGNTQIAIRNLLQLNQGSVIELDRFAGEPLDVLVNGTLIAHGEVVMVNDKFGIRLTDVISQKERIKNLS